MDLDAKRDAQEAEALQQLMARNELKLKLQNYNDIYEYKRVRWGPFWWTKKVLKKNVQDTLTAERCAEMSALDPSADQPEPDPADIPIPEEDKDQDDWDALAGDSKPGTSTGTAAAAAAGPAKTDTPAAPKKGGLVSRFQSMFARGDDDGDAVAARGGRKKRKKKPRKQEDAFEADQPARPPTPETNPVYRERKQGAAARPAEGFPWDLREGLQPYRVYVSAGNEDMRAELRLLFEDVFPALQKLAAARRAVVAPVYLQDGLDAREAVSKSCSV